MQEKKMKSRTGKKRIAPTQPKGTFTDPRDGKVYKTVEIGGQVWMAENLNFDCPKSKCYANNPKNAKKYGRLYDWETAMKICPPGWHLPSKEEWDKLIEAVGDPKTAGTNLKATSGWDDDEGKSGNGTDNYGFSAQPGGYGDSGGSFYFVGDLGYWWNSSEYDSDQAYFRSMFYNNSNASWDFYNKSHLFSVRCIKD
jgi:uncharacterized protein (TIGR02145 family)